MEKTENDKYLSKQQIHDLVARVLFDIKHFNSYPNLKSTDNIFKDLGFDSLDSVEAHMKLEEKFNIAIPEADWYAIENDGRVGAIVAYLEQQKPVNPNRKDQQNKPVQAPIIMCTTDYESIQFRQAGRVLNLNDPRVSPFIKALRAAMEKQK